MCLKPAVTAPLEQPLRIERMGTRTHVPETGRNCQDSLEVAPKRSRTDLGRSRVLPPYKIQGQSMRAWESNAVLQRELCS